MVKYRKMMDSDLQEIVRIGKAIPEFYADDNTGFWGQDDLKNLINSSRDYANVSLYNNKIIGFIIASYHQPTRRLTIENLYVKKEHRNKKIATCLLEECINHYRQKAKYVIALIQSGNYQIGNLLIKNGFSKGYTFNWYTRLL